MSLLTIRNLEAYYGPIAAVRGVSLEVTKGTIVTILGSNGAGKTTILKCISGILEPHKGTIHLEGDPVEGLDPSEIVRRGVAHVPEGREVFPLLSVHDNLVLGAYLRHDRAGAREDLERVHGYFPILATRAHQPAGELSGGEQQMLAIGRALMGRPRILLLDEPSLGLAPRLVQEIFAIIRRINEEQGTTILLVEQNAHIALETASYGYVLETGRIVLDDTAERLEQKDDVREFYLGHKEAGVRGKRRWKKRKMWR